MHDATSNKNNNIPLPPSPSPFGPVSIPISSSFPSSSKPLPAMGINPNDSNINSSSSSYQPPEDFYNVFAVTRYDKKSSIELPVPQTQIQTCIEIGSNLDSSAAESAVQPSTSLPSESPIKIQKQRPRSAVFEAREMNSPDFPSITSPSAMIFSAPNSVPDDSRMITRPDKSKYVAPIKAAGDVSLNGCQLVQFLIKASLKLKEGTTQEGVHLRLNKLHECVTNNQLSEASLKKLNYIVDEIDRELYDEAWTDFEQFVAKFPAEAAGWSQGLRILLMELKKISHRNFPNRTNSAGKGPKVK